MAMPTPSTVCAMAFLRASPDSGSAPARIAGTMAAMTGRFSKVSPGDTAATGASFKPRE